MSDRRPDREAIVEILSPHLSPGSSSPGVIADALLARLRPACEHWRSHYEAAQANWNEVLRERDALRADLEVYQEKLQEMAQTYAEIKTKELKADLRACAKALRTILPAMETLERWIGSHKHELHSLTRDDLNGFKQTINDARAALARPGVQAEMGK